LVRADEKHLFDSSGAIKRLQGETTMKKFALILVLAGSLGLSACGVPQGPGGSVVGASGFNNGWLPDTNPEGTYSPGLSGSGGADSPNVGYNPDGEEDGDHGVNDQGGFAPPPNRTSDPDVNPDPVRS